MQTSGLALNLLLLLTYTSSQGQKEHINLFINQVSHNTKIKSKERKQATNQPTKNVVE
jgi:hypothetical protein